MEFKTIQTERLRVRHLVPADVEAFVRYRCSPEVVKFQTTYTLASAKSLIQEMSQSNPWIKGKWYQFAIELTADGRLIGDIGFFNTDGEGKSWVGFTLDPQYWHKGYAFEAVRAILEYYRSIGVAEVWASTDPMNTSSMALLKRLGFSLMEAKPDDMIFSL